MMKGISKHIIVTLLTLLSTAVSAAVSVQYNATVCGSGTYLFGCQQLTSSGTESNTLGDSTVTLHLTVAPQKAVSYDATIELGQTYLFGCQQLTADAVETNTLQQSACGCDSTVTLHLSVQAPAPVTDTTVAYTAEIRQGETYLFGCDALKTAGAYTNTIDRINGGDSTINLTLNVCEDDTVFMATPIESCGKYHWDKDDQDYTTSGTYYCNGGALVPGSLCNQYYELQLVILEPATGTDVLPGCDSLVFKGKTYFTDDVVLDTIFGGAANGCDSIVTHTITILHHATGVDAVSGCAPVLYKGIDYLNDTIVLDTIAGGAENGCDSIVTVTITVLKATAGDTAAVVCDSIWWYGTKLTASGDYDHTLINAAGCDSILTLHLTINTAVMATPEIVNECHEYKWHDSLYTASGTYYDTLLTTAGCDSICTLQLTLETPYVTNLSILSKYGDRLLMINRNEINEMPGWSLDLENDMQFVSWFRESTPADQFLGNGYYYTKPNGDVLDPGTYYAVVDIPASEGAQCGAKGTTAKYTVSAAAPAPALVPTLAQPNEQIQVINLDPTTETIIRIYTADGLLQDSFSVSGEETFSFRAAGVSGFYLVELSIEGIKSSLRYIVK